MRPNPGFRKSGAQDPTNRPPPTLAPQFESNHSVQGPWLGAFSQVRVPPLVSRPASGYPTPECQSRVIILKLVSDRNRPEEFFRNQNPNYFSDQCAPICKINRLYLYPRPIFCKSRA